MSRFSEAVHWILRTGAQRRELLDSCGKWNSLLKGYARREENGGSYWIIQTPNVSPPPQQSKRIPQIPLTPFSPFSQTSSPNLFIAFSYFSILIEL